MLVPVEVVASHSGGVTGVAVVHRQVQGNRAVATGGIGEHMRQVVAAGGETCVLVPVEVVASHSGGVTGIAVTYC